MRKARVGGILVFYQLLSRIQLLYLFNLKTLRKNKVGLIEELVVKLAILLKFDHKIMIVEISFGLIRILKFM